MAQPRRADEGTAQTLNLGRKIGGDFVAYNDGKAPWLAERIALYEQFAAEASEVNKTKERPISITLPNGTVKEGVAFKTTPFEIASALSKSLAERLVIARVGYSETVATEEIVNAEEEESEDEVEEEPHACCGDIANSEDDPMKNTQLWDAHRPLEGDCTLFLLDFEHKDAQKIFWHSSAHVLGQALERQYGGHLTNGPALNPGFYYDAFVGDMTFGADHVAALQKMCGTIAKEKQKFERLVISKAQALELFKHNAFKREIISAKVPEGAKTTVYRCGTFVDLCLGPHVPSTASIKHLALTKNSSTYFLGDNQNDTLQRVYGVSFPKKEMLEEYITLLEEAKKRDHRIVGAAQDLFFFETNMSPGSAFWLPKGTIIYNKLCNFIRREYKARGFSEVITPNMFHCDLWKTSGHYQKYADGMYILNIEGAEWALKPMNCPSHCLMFKQMQPSYKQLPIRLADFGVLHRNEFSGSLSGLTRVRRFQQDDAHIFARMDQVKDEIVKALEFLFYVYDLIGFQYVLKLSTRPENRLGSDELWDVAEAQLKAALETTGKPFGYKHGDGAFYGPKIDIQVFDAMKRNHQCGTIQLDFQLPIRFDLQYKTAGAEESKAAKAEKTAAAAAASTGDEAAKKEKKSKKDMKVERASVVAERDAAAAEGSKTRNAEHTHDHARDASAHNPHAVYDFNRAKEFEWIERPVKPDHERPVIIHRAILGSVERMTAILTEHFGGKWPFFMSPRQAVVLPVSDKYAHYAEWVSEQLKSHGFDAHADVSNHTLKRKILDAQVQKWNYMLVVGAEEQATQTVTVRDRENPEAQEKLDIPSLIEKFEKLEKVWSRPWNNYVPYEGEAVVEDVEEVAEGVSKL